MKDRAHDDAMAEIFRKDPAYAVELLNSILEDGDQGELLVFNQGEQVLHPEAPAWGWAIFISFPCTPHSRNSHESQRYPAH